MNRISVKPTNVTAASLIAATAFLGLAAPAASTWHSSPSAAVSASAAATQAEKCDPKTDPKCTNPWD